MKTIWKHTLKITDTQEIEVPLGAEILNAQMQKSTIVLWILAESGHPTVKREVNIYGTGHECDAALADYVGTVQQVIGSEPLVWHVFVKPGRA